MIGLLSSDGCKEAERRSERGSGILNINTNKIVQRRADALVFQSLVWSPPLYSIENAGFVTVWRTARCSVLISNAKTSSVNSSRHEREFL